jgi:alkylated DNA repair dioxygenase AlkB
MFKSGKTGSRVVFWGVEQIQLFSGVNGEEVPNIPGFALTLNFVNAEEEKELLRHIDAAEWEHDWKRRIQQYGLGYGGEHGRKATWLRDFPDWLMPLAKRVGEDGGFERFPENWVINEYVPPLGIAPHRDYPTFASPVASVSLGSDILLDFVSPDDAIKVPVHVPQRSFWVITREARWKWKHGIAARYNDCIDDQKRPRKRRVSVTFRLAREPDAVPKEVRERLNSTEDRNYYGRK